MVNFSLRRTIAELRGVKVAQFSDFGLFSLYKTTKTYLPVTTSVVIFAFLHCSSLVGFVCF